MSQHSLEQYLKDFLAEHCLGFGKLVVAYSGGLDSSVLLHALAAAVTNRSRIYAIHINHHLQPEADDWQMFCYEQARRLKVNFIVESVQITDDFNIEAQARDLRYAALSEHLAATDFLFTAHHQDDQAETLLLNLLRGSGVDGLAGMQAISRLGATKLLRPFLKLPREDLEDYARDRKLEWIEDPSNLDTRYSRNFIRQDVLPLLLSRWPHASATISRSAENCREMVNFSSAYLNVMLDDCVGEYSHILQLSMIRPMTLDQRQLLIRQWLKLNQVIMPDRHKLLTLAKDFVNYDNDSDAMLEWAGIRIRMYLDQLFLFKQTALDETHKAVTQHWLDEQSCSFDLDNPAGQLDLTFSEAVQHELDGRLLVRHRQSGETVRLAGRKGSRKLKKLFQEWQIPPWLRDHVPLLFLDNQCIAVGDLAYCEKAPKQLKSISWVLPEAFRWK